MSRRKARPETQRAAKPGAPAGAAVRVGQVRSPPNSVTAAARPGSNPSTVVRRVLPPLLLVVAGLAAYANSFEGVFLFDDLPRIVDNPHIRRLWPLADVVAHTSRPVVELSLALNHALGGLGVWGYHAFNVMVHLLAGLALFGIVRRMFESPRLCVRYGAAAPWLALAVALLWLLHPLQTESVSYVIQRAESLMGLFFLLTLYCAIRGAQSPRPRRWYAAAVAACALGMGSKEVMITAPLVTLLYDRLFIAESFKEVFRQRFGMYAGLAATWLVLLVALAASRPEFASGVDPTTGAAWNYALTQFDVIVYYLRLAAWPSPLVLDYGWPLVGGVTAVLPAATVIVALLVLTTWGLFTQKWLAFWGAWFFLILAPTSSILPIADPAFEHRMYLPLAAVAVVTVVGAHELLRIAFGRSGMPEGIRRAVAACLLAVVAAALGYASARRNEDYRSEFRMWSDVVAKRPENARAQFSVAARLMRQGKVRESIPYYANVVRLRPDSQHAQSDLGVGLYREGQKEEGLAHLFEAVRVAPDFAGGHSNLAVALYLEGRTDEAITHYSAAIRLAPGAAGPHQNLGVLLARQGETERAIVQFREALRLDPDYADAHLHLGRALVRQGRNEEALAHFKDAVRLQPDSADARSNLRALQASLEQGKAKP